MSRSIKFGHGEGSVHITLNIEEQRVESEEGVLTFIEWEGIVKKMEKAMVQEGFKSSPVSTAPRSHGGPVSPAPWFLRYWYTKVIKKVEKYD